ncbi:9424_t:CDS:1, partial [Gigaspora rosea]
MTIAFARPGPMFRLGTLVKRSDLLERQGNTTCLCSPTNIPCESDSASLDWAE